MDYQIWKARVGGTTSSELYCKLGLSSFYNYFLNICIYDRWKWIKEQKQKWDLPVIYFMTTFLWTIFSEVNLSSLWRNFSQKAKNENYSLHTISSKTEIMSQLLTVRPSTYQAHLEVPNPRFLLTLGSNSKELNFIIFYNRIDALYSDYTQMTQV